MNIAGLASPSAAPSVSIDGIVGWERDVEASRADHLAVEEPLEIKFAGCDVAVTMRTPGDDQDLAAGFLFTEGIIRASSDIASIARCLDDAGEPADNIINVNPTDSSLVQPERWRRNFFATSSCGICGKASIDSVFQEAEPIESDFRVCCQTLYAAGRQLRRAQRVFGQTGGLHAAGLFDSAGRLICIREDVGRHNAVDKVVGDALRRGAIPLDDRILLVSGRASFEIVQKALMARISVIAAVSAPSSLAVELARSARMTLIGFLRTGEPGDRFNAYAGAQRIA